ncbi:hypothetical protein RFH42_02215 [Acinetobacter rudis]|uniref:hypothetical protein n=1 Tax=Acinetobacter rudis TaxID=632955 RepID=UPI00280E15A8|nr:hypothetical protein [Acinetobacter rudis]MDQ8951774.1 hypothetical protein [Acinetobacter rudis]
MNQLKKGTLFLLGVCLFISPLAQANYGHYERNGKGFLVDLRTIQPLNKQKTKFNVSADLIGFIESNDIPKSMLNQVNSRANLLIDCKAKTLAFQSVQVIHKPDGRILMENDQPNFKMSSSKSDSLEGYMIEDLCKSAAKL